MSLNIICSLKLYCYVVVCTYLSDVYLWSAFPSFFMNRYYSWVMNNVVKWCPLLYFWRCLCIYFYSLFNKLHSNMMRFTYCLFLSIFYTISSVSWIHKNLYFILFSTNQVSHETFKNVEAFNEKKKVCFMFQWGTMMRWWLIRVLKNTQLLN